MIVLTSHEEKREPCPDIPHMSERTCHIFQKTLMHQFVALIANR